MKTHSSRSPAAGSSSFCQTATHPPRTSKPAKASTPTASPRPPFSGGQTTPPILSPSRPPDGRAASPNYFGLVDSASDARQLSGLGRDAWGPAASSVKSFAAALPKQMLLEPTADVEAFRRQADLNRAQAFLPASKLALAQPAPRPASSRPRPSRWHTRTSDAGSDASSVAPSAGSGREPASSNTDTAGRESQHDSAYVSSVSKRSSMSSLPPAHITSLPVFESPRSLQVTRRPSTLESTDGELTARLSFPDISAEASPPATADPVGRAATLPSKPDAGPLAMISAARLKELMETVDDSRLLVLDIRSSQNYAQSRIEGALNLCIPTTLLKRPNFNIQKLQQTFQGGRGSAKFAAWRSMQWIVVYDAHASDKRDAVAAQNMVKKFINEGFTGHTAILRGGFSLFHKSYPKLVDGALAPPAASPSGCAVRGNGGLAPVIGGVHLPRSTGEVDPFFSNIRQNLDLADGVGQLDIARPADLESPLLPQWLREAASISDHGKAVSNKFLHIELEEQARMRTAYAAFQPGLEQQGNLRLCGVEKGGKNRYKDILPFEHARVRLQTRPAGSCDYINASHLMASMSNKRYIASQGPLPATFEDFWSVVWDQDVRVIVMLTAETEGGQLKCHSYWKGRDFGTLRMRQLSEQKASLDVDKHRTEQCPTFSANPASDLGRKRANTTTTLESSTATPNCAGCQGQTEAAYVMIRKFALSHSAEPFAPAREITHLCFPSWPDFGAPAQPSHLLALVELANLMQRAAPPVEEAASAAGGRAKAVDCMPLAWYDEPEVDSQARPMLVHCSAGCGRTGTFCTVDSVIDMLKRQRRAKMAAMRAGGPRGDSPMTAPDEAVSPRSRQAAGGPDPGFFDTAAGRSAAYAEAAGPGGCDTSWVGDEAVDLIQKTVRDFREQRLSMVQSLRQYVLCYETILEWLNRIRDRTTSSLGGRMRSGSLQQLLSAR